MRLVPSDLDHIAEERTLVRISMASELLQLRVCGGTGCVSIGRAPKASGLDLCAARGWACARLALSDA